jgi:GNAT superfamily N-acetyltransferase
VFFDRVLKDRTTSRRRIVASARILISAEILGFMSTKRVHEDYQALMNRLHGDKQVFKLPFLHRLKQSPTTITIFVVVDEKIVSTAQGSYAELFPTDHVYVNNVVTREGHDGKGYGKLAMKALERAARDTWGRQKQEIKMFLTNSPKKGNGGFYDSLGYSSRSVENDNATVVWLKDI